MATMKKQAVLDKLPKEGFVFDEASHLYALDGKPLTGVTTILSVIAKPALIQWAADETAKHLGWYNPKYVTESEKELVTTLAESQRKLISAMDCETYLKFLGEARVKHAKRKKDAGDIGTKAHALIEEWVIKLIEKNEGVASPIFNIQTVDEKLKTMVDHFVSWACENNVKFIESEKRMYSKTHWYAGTCDLVFEMDGKRYIGDIKTSSAIYNEHFFQMGGYEIALQEMGMAKVDGYLVINLKKDGTFDLKVAENTEVNKQAFLNALELYKIINSLE